MIQLEKWLVLSMNILRKTKMQNSGVHFEVNVMNETLKEGFFYNALHGTSIIMLFLSTNL